MFMLKWSVKLAALALAISLSGTPVMACLVPDGTESAEARECCRKMADQCGDMGMMPSTHSCCKVTTHQTDSYLVKSRFTSGRDQHLLMPLIAATNDFTSRTLSQAGSVAQAHSPPVSHAETISILRI
jgi:hypothetical protein